MSEENTYPNLGVSYLQIEEQIKSDSVGIHDGKLKTL